MVLFSVTSAYCFDLYSHFHNVSYIIFFAICYRELPEPIISQSLTPEFEESANKRGEGLEALLQKLPTENRYVACYFVLKFKVHFNISRPVLFVQRATWVDGNSLQTPCG